MGSDSSMDILLKFEDVAAGYTHPVVGPVSFQVARGEVIPDFA